jgi:plastocyanin domain-containing protein/YHS domain-containing protein
MIVNVLGIGLALAIVWYFFFSPREDAVSATSENGVQRILVRVKGGYIPDTIVARPGAPLEIAFSREEDSSCSEEVWFPTLGIKESLPAFETTLLRIPPTPAGRYPFTCGMSMLKGVLLLEPLAAPPVRETGGEEEVTDPVCGMRILPSRAAGTIARDGHTSYFCSLSCRDRYLGG